jgi:hypothetical protein
MKKLLDILFKDKAPEDRPSKVEIKLRSTITPEERLTEEEWKAEYKIGIAVEHREGIYNAHSMMQLWDEQRQIDYYKNLNIT